MFVLHRMVYRQKLNGRHTQPLQILDDGRGRKSGVGASQMIRHIRMTGGKPFDMDFVDDGLRPGRAEQMVASPAECLIDHHTLRTLAGIVTIVPRQISFRVADAVTEHTIG